MFLKNKAFTEKNIRFGEIQKNVAKCAFFILPNKL